MISIRPAENGDVSEIAPAMRPWDVRECRAMGFAPAEALAHCLDGSALAWTACLDGQPVAMFGAAAVSLVDGHGRPWMLGTEAVYRQGKAIMRLAPRYLAKLRALYPRMDNLVHQDNDRAIRLLRRLGFVMSPEARDVGGEPMVLFQLEP